MKKHLFFIFLFVSIFANQQDLFTQKADTQTPNQILNKKQKKQLIQQIQDEHKNLCEQLRVEANCEEYYKQLLPLFKVETSFSPTLFQIIQDLCIKMNINIPNVFIYNGGDYGNLPTYQTCQPHVTQENKSDNGNLIIGAKLFTSAQYALDYDELEALLAHELSHLKALHMPQQIKLRHKMIYVSLGLVLANGYAHYLYGKKLLTHFKVKSYHRAITVLSTLATSVGLDILLGLFSHKQSRDHEREADMTAVNITHKPLALAQAINKIHKLILEQDPDCHRLLTRPHRIFGYLLHDHPLPHKRKAYLQQAAIELEKKNSTA